MPTSTDAPSSDQGGFTLLELAIVLFVLAIATSFIVPRFRDVGTTRLHASASQLANTARYLYDEAAFRQRPMRLNFDLNHHRYWASELDPERDESEFVIDEHPFGRAVDLPGDVGFEDVVLPASGVVDRGVVSVDFYPEGLADPLVVHLRHRKGERATLAVEPLTGRARIAAGYIDTSSHQATRGATRAR